MPDMLVKMLDMTSAEGAIPENHWINDVDLNAIVEKAGSPVFIYSEQRLEDNIKRVIDAAFDSGLGERVVLYVPFFPNSNPYILEPLKRHKLGMLVQVPQELEIAVAHGFDDFIISPGHIGDDEIAYWNKTPYWTFLGSVDEVRFAIDNNAETLCLRVDALGSDKPGVKLDQLPALAAMLNESGRQLDCFEVYYGSGNTLEQMVDIVRRILQVQLDHFPDAKAINFAGGHGFDYKGWDPAEKHFNWLSYFSSIRELADTMGVSPDVKFLFEPARDLLADVGVLIADVKRSMISHSIGNIVVTNASRMLMPSAQMRDRAHNIAFLDKNFEPLNVSDRSPALVRGRTILRNDYLLPKHYDVPATIKAGDHMIVFDVGAYCATQHMEFLNVPPAPEVLINISGEVSLVTKPGNPLDKWRNLLDEPEVIGSRAEKPEKVLLTVEGEA
jgi:diaminopimelate decarboxylase